MFSHPATRASFCPFEWVGEKEDLPESGQTFVVAKAWTSDLVNLVHYRQTGFPSVSIRVFINQWSFLSPLYQVHVY